jgi:UDP-N-acetylmuramoyl-L-alanyl-D-glutamate--2,6-diaminopimelate ligase
MARWFVDRSAQRGIPSISLRRLLPDARFLGCHDLHASGCSADSRRLDPGQVFVAIRGARHDGHAFVGHALERGAAAVVVERPCPEAGRPQVIVPDSRLALARICQALAGEPSEALRLVGITGVTGREAASLFLRAITEAHGDRFGAVGDSGWTDGVKAYPPGVARPGPAALAEMLAAMVERGCVGGVIEADGDGDGDGDRFGAIRLHAAIATSVAGPDAEPPAALQARRRRQARLFRGVVPGGVSIVNADDPDADLLSAVNFETRRVSFATRRPADVTARIVRLDAAGTRFRLFGFDREATVALRPVGRGHLAHALAAAAWAWSREVPTDAVVAGLESVARVPGRLDPLGPPAPFDVRSDRARTAAELAEALSALRETATGQVHCLLGLSADPSPRAALALAAERGSDRLILTLADPRPSDPDSAIDEAIAALRSPGRARVEPDRRRAIESTLALAQPGDALLLAGDGLHALPLPSGRDAPCGDRAIVAHWLEQGASRRRSA